MSETLNPQGMLWEQEWVCSWLRALTALPIGARTRYCPAAQQHDTFDCCYSAMSASLSTLTLASKRSHLSADAASHSFLMSAARCDGSQAAARERRRRLVNR